MLIDLNARRAARSSAEREPKQLRVGDRTYELVPEIMLSTVQAVNDGNLARAAKHMLANPDADYEDFCDQVSLDDLGWLITNYGANLGESSGSTEPLNGTGEPSTPTFDATTDLTSPTSATDVAPGEPPASSPT
jgi:hypothetical protein